MTSRNLAKAFRDLIPATPLQVGNVIATDGGGATIELPGGGRIHARGDVAAGERVFVRSGVVDGPAPDLPVVLISV